MHGKTWEAGSGRPDSFHRPTAIELVVEPHYRIYYAGPYLDELSERIQSRHSQFHTYLGSAFCLTFPEWISEQEAPFIVPAHSSAIDCVSVLPTDAVGKLLLENGRQYARAGGMLWSHEGEMHERRFRGRVVAVIYEVNGGVLRFEPTPKTPESFWAFHDIPGEGMVCLW
jgi:CRISPR-associated protein Cas5h